MLEYLNSDSGNKRKIYVKLLHSAYVFKEQIILRFINDKIFVVKLGRNRGKYIQTLFSIKVYYKWKYQYSILLDTKENEFEISGVPYRNKFYNQTKHNILLNEIRELKNKIQELKEVEVQSI